MHWNISIFQYIIACAKKVQIDTCLDILRLFMTNLEEEHIYRSHHFANEAKWWRYFDDIFVIWTDTIKNKLHEFFQFLNTLDLDIKFTMTSSPELQFLDTLVTRIGKKFETDLYRKPTGRNNLLRYESCHPRPMLKSLPFSQMLRVKMIVPDPTLSEIRLVVTRENSLINI